MKKLCTFVVLVFLSAVLFAGGAAAPAGSSGGGKAVVSAPGVFPITKEKVTLDTFMVFNPDACDDLSTNTSLSELEALTNVHLNLTIANASEESEKFNLLMNSGQYPEVIVKSVGASDLVRYGATEKMFIPLNDLIDTYTVNLKKYFQDYPWVRESITSPDGNIYGIPSIDSGAKVVGHGSISYKLWFNNSWLTRLGLSKPTTTEEFRTVLRAFKTRDPNGNGRADEIPLSGAYGTWAADPYLYLLNAFGYYNETNVMLKNDRFQPVADQDYIREGLAYIKTLYDEELLDPASLSQTMEQLMAIGNHANDIVLGSFTAGHVAMGLDIADVERARNYTTLEPLRGPSGYQGVPFSGDEAKPTAAAFIITDKCKEPVVAIRVSDAFNTEEMAVRTQVGIKGRNWDTADPGTFGMDGKTPAKYKYLNYLYSGVNVQKNDTLGWIWRQMEPNWKLLFQVSGDIRDTTNYEAFLVQETLKLVPYAADVQIVPPLAYSEDVAGRMSRISTPINDYVKNSFVEFITGKRNLNTDWETYKQNLERLGYSEYINHMQTAYNQIKK
ncbi:MAG: extracellular solute-binding protein [Treponema sp.]|jgi:putative aldouronate transport system substrate-binding protein|nr:extracellular solute-binding protein [Treponema sp.]